MDPVSTHIIGKNIISFQYNGSSDPLALQQAFNRWVEQKWVPGLEQELNKYGAGTDTVINVDRLEIEMNLQQQDNWLEDLLPVLLNEIGIQLKQYTGSDEMDRDDVPVSERHTWNSFTAILSHFLTTGILPWNVPKRISANFKTQLADWLQQAPVNDLWVIIGQLNTSSALKRFFSLLFNSDLIQLISRLTDMPVTDILKIENDLTAIKDWRGDNRYDVRDWKKIFIDQAILHRHDSKKLLQQAVIKWLQQDDIKPAITKTSFPLHILKHRMASGAVQQIQRSYQVDPAMKRKQKGIIPDQDISAKDKPGAEKIKEVALPSIRIAMETNRWNEADVSAKNKTDAISSEGIYLPFAGTVVIAPFLPALLERTGLAVEGRIKSADSALNLIYYAATGKERPAEFELVLPKILCGLELQDAVETGTALSVSEKSEADEMLCSVIAHWKVLGNTSVEGLRSSFLQREGKITRSEKGEWQLMVQQEAYDMLLQQLPWSIGIIRLPWMEQNLITHWI
ncbi:contractile injection system tape measure protein [Niabella aquatica]